MPIMSRLSLHPTAGGEKLATMRAEKDKEVDKAKKMDLHNGHRSIKARYDKVMKTCRGHAHSDTHRYSERVSHKKFNGPTRGYANIPLTASIS